LAFVNKVERENADLERIVGQISAKLGVLAVRSNCPSAVKRPSGVVDLLTQKALLGEKGAEGPIPPDMVDAVEEARMRLVEAAAEAEDSLMEKYFGEETLSEDEIRRGLRVRIARGDLVPVLCGSAAMNIGLVPLMQAVVQFCLLGGPALPQRIWQDLGCNSRPTLRASWRC
jgi:elongation factor G